MPTGPSLVGTDLVLDVGPIAHGGHCVARAAGQVVFVRHALPGERVRARVTEGGAQDRYLRADAVEVLAPSPHRVESPCRHAGPGGCGGCDLQHVALGEQCVLKACVVAEALHRHAGLDWPVSVEALPGHSDGLDWRTRMTFAVDEQGRIGLRAHRSRQVVEIDRCPIADPRIDVDAIPAAARPRGGTVRVVATGAGALVAPPGAAGPPTTMLEPVDTGAWSGQYRVDVGGFWQAHPGAAATYVARLLADLAPRPGERAVDLYAGVGLFAVPLARAVGPTGTVHAVEGDPGAAANARTNLAAYPWAEVEHAPVESALARLDRADLVVLDPTRRGAGRAVVTGVCALGARAVLYVACDPVALARDLAYARAQGYALSRLAAYDAFPMTHHVECLALLEPADSTQ